MFAKNSASDIKSYIDNLPVDRREIIQSLDKFIKTNTPSLKAHFAYNMLGYGNFEYLDKRTKEYKPWPIVALASQKNYISIYVCALDGENYLAEKYADRLGKVSVGKSCIRFKNIEDLNLDVLKDLLKEAEKSPGLVGLTTKN
ncbi:DUF1801 domain-containing protein [Candidatus Woesebacteria bacterium]|nr:DUF1801 domain-containing protein [Candidatus Woesebacteria bacterium]